MPDDSHPPPEELAAFALGKPTLVDHAAIETHLRNCAACTRLIELQPEDPLLLLARQTAPGPASNSPVDNTPTTRADVRIHFANDTLASAHLAAQGGQVLPAELADHSRYRLLRLHSQGGMGMVYVAEHRVMQRPVALKVIHRVLTSNPSAVERFRREVRAAARLQHPNIITAYDADQAGDMHFLVMEFVEGVTLGQLLQTRGRLPVPEACEYIRQAALGLQHAYERGMVHRDIKPENLMLTNDGTVKLLDFGLAMLTLESAADGLTSADTIMGTPDYMSPEQAEDAHAADTRSDIYSLGCTLFVLLTGQIPFPATTTLKKIFAHREKEPPPLCELCPGAPPELAALAARMLAKKPADRFQTPGEVAAALAPFAKLSGRPTTARKRSRFVAIALLALLGIAAIGVAVFLSVHGLPEEETIATNDPQVAVVVKGRQVVRLVNPITGKTWDLSTKHYWLGMAEQPEGLTIELPDREPVVLHYTEDGILKVGPSIDPGSATKIDKQGQ